MFGSGFLLYLLVLNMDIPTLRTQACIREMETDGHAPLVFQCDNGQVYFCKYRKRGSKAEETDCLTYELVAHFLLRRLEIPTPDVAFVRVMPDSFSPDRIKQNFPWFCEGITCFGSKIVPKARDVSPVEIIKSRRDFHTLANPLDLIKIALFDAWVGNADRGKSFDGGYNFNLLLADTNGKQQYVAFDHAFIFGGINELRIFNPRFDPPAENLVFCKYFRSVVRYVRYDERINIIRESFALFRAGSWRELISNVVAQCAEIWPLPSALDKRMHVYLGDAVRLAQLETVLTDRLTKDIPYSTR